MDSILSMSAGQLATAIRTRAVSPLEVVDAHVARIEAVNPRLNALVAQRFDAARAEARAAEARVLAAEDLPPFHGVPCTIKEAIWLEGMPNTAGMLSRRTHVAPRDAVSVRRLRAAGFIPLGVTNVPECCFWMETDNLVFGRTRNPYDPACSAGGSSGGEAAIIGAGGAPLGLGSDVGGSIRIPSTFCGVFGHKPTNGLVPMTGHWPFYDDGTWQGDGDAFIYNTVGPIARRAGDLMPVLRALSGPDGFDPQATAPASDAPLDVDWRGRRVYVLAAPRIDRTTRTKPAVEATVRRAAAHLAERGAVVEEAPADLFERAFLIWSCSLAALTAPRVHVYMGGGRPPSIFLEALRHLVGRPRVSLQGLEYCAGEALFPLIRNKARFVQLGRELAARVTAMLSPGAVLLMPAHPRPAPRHNAQMLTPFDHAYTAIINILGAPATAVPMGFDERGLPLGLQVVAAPHHDHVSIAAAVALEEAFGGWQPPRL
jgi:fatty acid amide hydrolase 2